MGTLFSLSKSAASTALDISEIALLVFGVLLVVGLIGEYAKSERWKKHVRVFEMFVIIGVAGELIADGGIFLFSSHLQTISDGEIAALNDKASHADERAAQFDQEAAALREKAAELQKGNLDLEKSLLALKERTKWRTIPPEKRPTLIKLLSSEPKGAIGIVCISAAGDACPFAEEIWEALRDSNWPPISIEYSMGADSSVGQGILVKDANHAPPFAVHLYKAFKAIDIDLPGVSSPIAKEGEVTVKIGRNPNRR